MTLLHKGFLIEILDNIPCDTSLRKKNKDFYIE